MRSISYAKTKSKKGNDSVLKEQNSQSIEQMHESIHEKSFKNLIGSEHKLQSIRYFFKKKNENCSVDPKIRQRH